MLCCQACKRDVVWVMLSETQEISKWLGSTSNVPYVVSFCYVVIYTIFSFDQPTYSSNCSSFAPASLLMLCLYHDVALTSHILSGFRMSVVLALFLLSPPLQSWKQLTTVQIDLSTIARLLQYLQRSYVRGED